MNEEKCIYDDLITLLKKAKHPNDLNDELFNKLINETILTGIAIGTGQCFMSPKSALTFTKEIIADRMNDAMVKYANKKLKP